MGTQTLKPLEDATGVPEVSATLGIGVCLEATEAYRGEWTGSPTSGEVTVSTRCRPSIPPSALLPRLLGEPVRADVAWPSHPRGSGEVWPPEAVVTEENGAGRFPLAYAWSMLGTDEARTPAVWPWRLSVNEHLTPADAIAAVFTATSGEADALRGIGPPALVVPNDLREWAQRDLIDAAARQGTDVKLLWRPIAAALGWCEHHRSVFDLSTSADESIGTLLTLHLGIDCFEATVLQLVPKRHSGQVFLIPARGRPDGEGRPKSLVSPWFHLLHRIAGSLVQAGRADERVWQLLWTTPWLSHVLSLGRGRNGEVDASAFSGPEWDSRRLEEARSKAITLIGSRVKLPGSFRFPASPVTGLIQVEEWFRKVRVSLHADRLVGAIVTGPLAADLAPGGATYGHERVRSLWPNAMRVLVEGADVPCGLLAGGAALYAARAAADLPTYLDTLPRLRTVVRRDGEPRWESLLQEEAQFVEGGKLWRRRPNLDGLAIPKLSPELAIALDHGEYRTVRQVTVPLGREFDHSEPISLAVSIEPAQGGAKIEVAPQDGPVFGRRRVFVEWRRMLDVGQTPQQFLDSLPRIFPELAEREASWSRWTSARASLEAFLKATGPRRGQLLDEAIATLRQKDQELMPRDATAVSSEGIPPGDPDVLGRFVDAVAQELLFRTVKRNDWPVEKITRVLGYTSTNDPRLMRHIGERIKYEGASLQDYDLVVCGSCLRDPAMIARFSGVFIDRMRRGYEGTNDWLKAMGSILRYRTDATKCIPTADCEEMTRHALEVFERELAAHNPKFRFRNACLIIVYLLRKRAYEDNYLDPASPLATRSKRSFTRAIEAHDRRDIALIGGAVDLRSALQMMVKYIDRRGSGKFLLGV